MVSNFTLHFIDDPIYRFKVNFLIGGSHQEFLDTIEASTGIRSKPSSGKTLGCFLSSQERDLYFLWLPRNFTLATLGHEITHILYTMFESVGVPTAAQNQETFAYHWEWWFEKVRSLAKIKQ